MSDRSKKQRLFIGIFFPRTFYKRLKPHFQTFSQLPVRWVPEKNLHITLVPPFYTDDLDSVKAKLNDLQRVYSVFKVRFNAISVTSRMIWAEVDAPDRLHVTLARFGRGTIKDIPKVPIDLTETVKNFSLIESQTLSEGAVYKKLLDVKLR